jgi:hypothetical protein
MISLLITWQCIMWKPDHLCKLENFESRPTSTPALAYYNRKTKQTLWPHFFCVTGIELDLMLASILAGAEPGIGDRGSISFHLHVKSFHTLGFLA